MTRKHWLDLGPSVLLGIGIVVATLVAKLAAGSGWLVLAGPLLLAVAVVSADVLAASRGRHEPSAPSRAAWIMGGAILLAAAIVAPRDPKAVMTLIPIVGMASWVTLRRPERPCKAGAER